MSEQLKFIVQELSKPPYKKSYNLISFDGLEPISLIQVLNDVCAVIDPKNAIDIREEPADQTAQRLYTFLRVLKFRPLDDNAPAFKEALVTGDKPHLYTAIEWLLQRGDELKMRAYLARYLVKIDVPQEILQDDAVNDLYIQYEACMGDFKELHKQKEQARTSGFSTTEIKKDIEHMESEKEQVEKRIEKLKRKVEGNSNTSEMLAVARNLRMERDRENKLSNQKQDLQNALTHAGQRAQRLQAQLKDVRQASVGATPDGMLRKLQEECKINDYMLNEKIPKEVKTKRKYVQDLERVVSVPAMGQGDLDDLNERVTALNMELNQLYEKKMKSGDPTDDKLVLFRQQAQIIARKKEAAAESLNEARNDLHSLKTELREKQAQVQDTEGQDVLKGEDFKRYVNKLRSKSTLYKKKRQELQDLRAESGVAARTLEILQSRDTQINQQLDALEAKKGVAGYRDTQEELEKVSTIKSDLDDVKGRTLEDMSDMVQRFHKKINEKKSDLAPVIKELRPLRQKAQELLQDYEAAKAKYDTAAAGYESNRSRIEHDVKSLREECSTGESRLFYLNSMKKITENQKKRIDDEMKAYMSSDPQERKKSFRELYNRKIQEQEVLGKNLRERQKSVRENHTPSMKQMKMWKDVQRLMESKLALGHGSSNQDGQLRGGSGEEERLVL